MHFTQLCDNWAVLNPDCPLFLLEAPREGNKKKKNAQIPPPEETLTHIAQVLTLLVVLTCSQNWKQMF